MVCWLVVDNKFSETRMWYLHAEATDMMLPVLLSFSPSTDWVWKPLQFPLTVNCTICLLQIGLSVQQSKRETLVAGIQQNYRINELKVNAMVVMATVATSSLMSHFMKPARANQTSFRSENLLCDQKPEAANDKSSSCIWSPSLCPEDMEGFVSIFSFMLRWHVVISGKQVALCQWWSIDFLLASSGLISHSPTCRSCSPLWRETAREREDGTTSSCSRQRS